MSEKQTSDFVGGLQDAVRQNPVSAALIGMGLIWMLTGGSRITAAAALMGPAARAAADGVGTALNAASGAAATAVETTRSLGTRAAEQTRDAVAQASDSVSELATNAYNAIKPGAQANNDGASDIPLSPIIASLKDTFERQPLLLGAIGLAIGTAIATALPATKIESDFAGETADRVTAQVKDLASGTVEQVKEAASRAFEAVKDEAAAQGLTAESAKAGAAALGQKVSNVAAAARHPGVAGS
jgi:hypothetical protein